jgi:hypothetical protein
MISIAITEDAYAALKTRMTRIGPEREDADQG